MECFEIAIEIKGMILGGASGREAAVTSIERFSPKPKSHHFDKDRMFLIYEIDASTQVDAESRAYSLARYAESKIKYQDGIGNVGRAEYRPMLKNVNTTLIAKETTANSLTRYIVKFVNGDQTVISAESFQKMYDSYDFFSGGKRVAQAASSAVLAIVEEAHDLKSE